MKNLAAGRHYALRNRGLLYHDDAPSEFVCVTSYPVLIRGQGAESGLVWG